MFTQERHIQASATPTLTLTASDAGTMFYIDAANHNIDIVFPAAAVLTANGPFMIGVKKVDVTSTQPRFLSSAGEKVDVVYTEQRIIQTQDSAIISATVDPNTGIGGINTISGSFNRAFSPGHRTITVPTYNMSAFDHSIWHRAVPASCSGGPQPINVNLPPIIQMTGSNPDGSPCYLSKPVIIQKFDNSAHPVQVFPFGGEKIGVQTNGALWTDRLILRGALETVILCGLGNIWSSAYPVTA